MKRARCAWRAIAFALAALVLSGCELIPIPRLPLPGSGDGPAGVGQELELPGLVHRATRANPVRRVALDVPPGVYHRVIFEVTIRHAGWSSRRPNGAHMLFWLARDRNRDLIGYSALRNRKTIFLRHGLGQQHGDKAKVTRRFGWPSGATYRLRYVYDTDARMLRLTIRDGSRTLVSLDGRPNVRSLVFRSGQRLVTDLGFTGTANPNEPASIGWEWTDLRLEID